MSSRERQCSGLEPVPSLPTYTSQGLRSTPEKDEAGKEILKVVQVHSQEGHSGWVGWKEREECKWTRAPGQGGFEAIVTMVLASSC